MDHGQEAPCSVIHDVGRMSSSCGYCKQENSGETSITHGLVAEQLSVSVYQNLIDYGFRRSGTFLYKPLMPETCCCAYTIRLDVTTFQPSKSQRKLLRTLDNLLRGSSGSALTDTNKACHDYKPQFQETLTESLQAAMKACINEGTLPHAAGVVNPIVVSLSSKQRKFLGDDVHYASAIALAISNHMQKSGVECSGASSACSIAGSLCHHLNQSTHSNAMSDVYEEIVKFEAISSSNGFINFRRTSGGPLSTPNQHACRGISETLVADHLEAQPAGDCGSPADRFHEVMKLDVEMVPATFDQESFDLYERYQVVHHGDNPAEVTPESYKRFLVESPLLAEGPGEDPGAPECGYGSFHQKYRLNGKLIAVGVVDILPRCLSSVYLFWDPDYSHLSLGKLSALQEIEWVRQSAARSWPSGNTGAVRLRYYYLGFFISTCKKMRYKAEYGPSDLLCPKQKVWVRITPEVLSAIDADRFVILSSLPGATCSPTLPDLNDESLSCPLESVLLLIQGCKIITWQRLQVMLPKEARDELSSRLHDWLLLTGPTAAQLLYAV